MLARREQRLARRKKSAYALIHTLENSGPKRAPVRRVIAGTFRRVIAGTLDVLDSYLGKLGTKARARQQLPHTQNGRKEPRRHAHPRGNPARAAFCIYIYIIHI